MTVVLVGCAILTVVLLLALAYDLRHRRRGDTTPARATGASRRERRRDDHIQTWGPGR